MARINGVDVDRMQQTVETFTQNPQAAHKTNQVTGVYDPETGMFTGQIVLDNGRTFTLQADHPPFLGGEGRAPGALHYCLMGFAACYVGTLVAVAAGEGVHLGEVRVHIENDINFRPVLGIADEPTVEQVRIRVEVSTGVDAQTLQRIKEKADRQCPGMYCLTQPIPVTTQVVAGR